MDTTHVPHPLANVVDVKKMNELFKEIFATYGPTAIPWVLFVGCAWFLWKEKYSSNDIIKPYHDFIDSYRDLVDVCHDAIKENTKVIERLSVLIEERTRRQNSSRD